MYEVLFRRNGPFQLPGGAFESFMKRRERQQNGIVALSWVCNANEGIVYLKKKKTCIEQTNG